MPDYLHLSKKGYQIWADSIQEPLAKVLGAN
jgi:lysophospholipase L1-like esterase